MSNLDLKSRSFDQYKEEASDNLFELREKVTTLNVELESNKAELKATKQNLTKEQNQVVNFTENLKAQSETAVEKINALEGQLSRKEDELITLKHKVEIQQILFETAYFTQHFKDNKSSLKSSKNKNRILSQ